MNNSPEDGLNVPLDDEEQRRLAAEAERAGLSPQQYAHDTLMDVVNERLILEIARETVARCGPAFIAAEEEEERAAEREAQRAVNQIAAQDPEDQPLGSRNLPHARRSAA